MLPNLYANAVDFLFESTLCKVRNLMFAVKKQPVLKGNKPFFGILKTSNYERAQTDKIRLLIS